VFQATGVSPSEVSLEVEIGNVALAVDKAIPCGLILNELITDALKHAFPEGRRWVIRVELDQSKPLRDETTRPPRAGASGFS